MSLLGLLLLLLLLLLTHPLQFLQELLRRFDSAVRRRWLVRRGSGWAGRC